MHLTQLAYGLVAILLLCCSVTATPSPRISDISAKKPRPLVVWHGLGDSATSKGMLQFASLIEDVHPGIFVHLVYIEEDQSADQRAGFYGNVDEQVDKVANQIKNITELKGGFDAIGFSQGGQFLRAYVERYNSPPVRTLITFGSQHMGVSDVPTCRPGDFLCSITRRLIKTSVYSTWAQNNLVQAQYFRDPNQLDTYLASNHFLTSINNEIPGFRNETYARNLVTLDYLVLVIFSEDKTVVPKESAWFGSAAVDEEDPGYRALGPVKQVVIGSPSSRVPGLTVPMRKQPLYIEDWIGLRELDEKGNVLFETCEGEHMQLGDCWEPLVRKFCGGTS